jgi:hypothetical protein
MNQDLDVQKLTTASKFPQGSTQHFLDAVFLVYGREASEEFMEHIEKYGREGTMEQWQVEMMAIEVGEYYGTFEMFIAGYFGGSVRELKYAQL